MKHSIDNYTPWTVFAVFVFSLINMNWLVSSIHVWPIIFSPAYCVLVWAAWAAPLIWVQIFSSTKLIHLQLANNVSRPRTNLIKSRVKDTLLYIHTTPDKGSSRLFGRCWCLNGWIFWIFECLNHFNTFARQVFLHPLNGQAFKMTHNTNCTTWDKVW